MITPMPAMPMIRPTPTNCSMRVKNAVLSDSAVSKRSRMVSASTPLAT
jgi:hypothetical protein